MEFSEILSFFTILKESIQILPRNGKLTASTALLSSLLPSILLLSFIHIYQNLTDTFKNDSRNLELDIYLVVLKYFAPLLLSEIAYIFVFFAISHVSGLTTIIVSSASYTGNDSLSSKDVWTSIQRTWRKTLFHSPRRSWTSSMSIILLQVPVFAAIVYPNFFTIAGAVIVGTVLVGFQLYSSVVWALSVVVMVLEESCSGERAVERAGELVKGGRMQFRGFMLNLFVNLVSVVVLGVVWVFCWKGSSGLAVFGLVFINVFSVMKMVLFTAYTVLYFQCRKHRGEEIVGFGDAEYTKLMSSSMVVDHEIP